jgi:hypothetical protein
MEATVKTETIQTGRNNILLWEVVLEALLI